MPNRIAGPVALALTAKPKPGVLNTTPRGEFTLKKLAGNPFGEAKVSGTPSQLISRRPLPKDPTVFALSGPRDVRNASTCGWMPAAEPDADDTVCASRLAGRVRQTVTSNIRELDKKWRIEGLIVWRPRPVADARRRSDA